MAADWSSVKRVFEEALGQPAARRAGWLAESYATEPTLSAEVRSLLDAHERAGTFLETSGLQTPADDERLVGRQLGPYRLESVLGRGGMGVVYLARRTDPERRVAVKVVAASAAPAARRLFETEMRILARFDHPCIARLYDSGMTAEGQPYFVMEWVDGLTLDRYCAHARPDLRARVLLFLDLCAALSYAHGRLVVHRDVKPGNVLVTADGRPKLLDFGIARLLDEAGGQTTETGLRLMTPEFASPEQVRGEPAAVTTDVHALGLLLHLLLTGRSAFRLTGGAPAELVRVVCLEDAPAASHSARTLALEAHAPATGRVAANPPAGPDGPTLPGEAHFTPPEPPARLARLLAGDLDAIVARALRKEPQHRYASVEQLAQDVRRYLDGRPVLARGGRWRYRLGKFVRRQRLPLALGAGLVLALLGGLLAATAQARVARAERARAERRFADVRRLATGFLFDFHDAVADLPGSTHARALVVGKALEYLDRLASEAAGDHGLQLELARAYQRLGSVQGAGGQANLGDQPAARRSFERAQQILEAIPLAARDAAVESARVSIAVDIGRVDAAAGNYDRQLARLSRFAAEVPAELPPGCDRECARARVALHHDLGREWLRRENLAAAEVAQRSSLALARAAQVRWPQDVAIGRQLVSNTHGLAVLLLDSDRLDEARDLARRAVALARTLRRPDDTGGTRTLALALTLLGGIESAHHDERGARASHAEAIALARELERADPGNHQARRDLAVFLSRWCDDQVRLRLRDEGDTCGEGVRRFEALVRPQDATTLYNVAVSRLALARSRALRGDHLGARRAYAAAWRAFEAPALAGLGDELASNRAVVLAAQAETEAALGRRDVARAQARSATALLRPLAGPGADTLDQLDLHLRLHTFLARLEPAGRRCAELERGRPIAVRLRALARQAGYLATLRAFDQVAAACWAAG